MWKEAEKFKKISSPQKRTSNVALERLLALSLEDMLLCTSGGVRGWGRRTLGLLSPRVSLKPRAHRPAVCCCFYLCCVYSFLILGEKNLVNYKKSEESTPEICKSLLGLVEVSPWESVSGDWPSLAVKILKTDPSAMPHLNLVGGKCHIETITQPNLPTKLHR